MKAAFIESTGPAEATIRYGELPLPDVQDGQVLIKTGAVAVNPIDTYLRNGANYWELPKPFIIGADVAGTVERVAHNAQRFRPGDRVWGSNQGLMGRQGTFSEYCAIDEQWLYPTPDNITDEEAAACALVGITAHLGLFREAKLQAGETLLVNGGSGGVGSMVVQMAKIAGARVAATAGSKEKVEALKSLGVDLALNYKSDDLASELQKFAPGGVNVYWETVREPDFDKIVSYMAERGRIVMMAGRDARSPLPVGPFYVKELSLHGFVMFKASADELRVCADDMNRWFSEGKLKANISKVLPLSQAADAHKLQEDNTLHKAGTIGGKIVLKP